MNVRLHTALARDGALTMASRYGESGDWVEHARGRVRRLLRDRPPAVDAETIRDRLPDRLDVEEHYATCARVGLPYGPAFRTLIRLRAGDGEVLADYAATVEIGDAHVAHPTVLDGAFQAGLPLLAAVTDDPVPFLPVGIEVVRCWAPMPPTGLVHLQARSATAQEVWWDLTVTDPHGAVALEVRGLRLRRFDATRPALSVPLIEVLRAAPLPGTPTRAVPLPAPGDVLAVCAAELAALTERWHAHPYAQAQPRVLDMAAHFTAAAIQELLPGQDTFTVDDLLAVGVDPGHTRLLHGLTGMALQRRVLTDMGAGRLRVATDPVPHQLFQAALRDFPAQSVAVHCYGVCGLHLASVLRGEQDPLDLLCSEADALAARLYDSTPVMHYHNQIAQQLLRAAVAGWPVGRPLRVLEVGAGTGGLTAALLPHLPPERTHYT
ncbi:MAG: polyketide synthase dehydratase domain-containing protein, partial [Actinomycetes bacterium]